MSDQTRVLRKAYTKLGEWLSWSTFGHTVPDIELDGVIATINLARSESETTSKVVQKMRAMAINEWVRRPTDEEIRDLLTLAADLIVKNHRD